MKALGGSTGSLLVLALLATAAPASAQVRAGPTREEITRPPVAPVPAAPSRLTVEGGVERAPCPLADEKFKDITVQVSEVHFDNLRVVAPGTLRPAYEAYLGKTVPIATVCEIRDASATILRRAGYLAAVQVPPQRIENGVIHFDVLMAKLVAVQVRGDAGKAEKLIAGYLNEIKGREAFNEKEAERYLLLARDLPGFDVRLMLRPAGTAPGEVIGEVSVEKIPFVIDASVQNFGSHDVGRWGGQLRGEFYDLLGQGDRATLGFYATPQIDEQRVLQLGYDLRIGSEGLTLGGRFTYAWSEPDLGDDVNGRIKSETMVAGLELGYPLVRRQDSNLRAALGFELIDQDVRFGNDSGFLPLTRDRLRVLYGRLDFDMIDPQSLMSVGGFSIGEPRWRFAGSLEVRFGLDMFGASEGCGGPPYLSCFLNGATPPSRIEGDPTASLARYTMVGEFRPVPNITFSLSPRAQFTNSALLSYEEFSAGNYTVGRGYDPGALIGDTGVGFQAELRYGRMAPNARDDLTFQPFVFFDKAWIWNRDQPTAPFVADPQELSSAGGGVRLVYGDRGRLDVTLAKGLEKIPTATSAGIALHKPDARLLISLTTRLYPWLQ
ncbi:heme:hemopexin-binding protein [Sphingomonas sp. DBB INV C78]|uniref:ShlB/FhaC/HecB family hemolysin secretion/activation protein n=1 Tax=Sphingomonas sp. DBB INV C78 TaxID=3349434 RepID=UPI0036D3D8F1